MSLGRFGSVAKPSKSILLVRLERLELLVSCDDDGIEVGAPSMFLQRVAVTGNAFQPMMLCRLAE